MPDPADVSLRISSKFRIALAAKGLLLLMLAAVFGALLVQGTLLGDHALPARALSLVVFGVCFAFLGWTTALAFADAVLGRAVRIAGAVALKPRRLSGVSFRLPGGRPAEFVLYNPWSPLVPGNTYTVTVGRFSRVLVEPHVAES